MKSRGMRSRWGLATAATMAAALVVVPASPAAAFTPLIAIYGPADGATTASTAVPITGSADIDPGFLSANKITGLKITVTLAGNTAASCDGAGCAATYGTHSTAFSFKPTLTSNGHYTVAVDANANEYFNPSNLLAATPRSSRGTTSVRVAVPPAAPHGVAATANPDRSVTVSWASNPEPDIIGWYIQRLGPGAPLTTVKDFLPASTLTWTDTGTTKDGGTYGYVVTVVRPDGDGSKTHALIAPSKLVGVSVPFPPAPETTTVPVGGVPGSTTTTLPPLPPGVDLSNFLAQASAAGATTPQVVVPTPHASSPIVTSGSVGSAPEPPDPGFLPTLPFPAVGPGHPSGETGSGGGPVVGIARDIGGSTGSSGQHPLLLPIAAGLLLCVLGFHLRWFSRRTRTEWMEPLLPVLDFIAGARAGSTKSVSGSGPALAPAPAPASPSALAEPDSPE